MRVLILYVTSFSVASHNLPKSLCPVQIYIDKPYLWDFYLTDLMINVTQGVDLKEHSSVFLYVMWLTPGPNSGFNNRNSKL